MEVPRHLMSRRLLAQVAVGVLGSNKPRAFSSAISLLNMTRLKGMKREESHGKSPGDNRHIYMSA